jgi:hypothetical protein
MRLGLGLGLDRMQRPSQGFAGDLDAFDSSIVGAWSVARRLLTSYEGPLIRLRRGNDNAESDLSAGGDGNLAGVSSFLGGNAGYGRLIYGQKGAVNWSQTTAASQPAFVASGINSKPSLQGDGINDDMTLTGLGAQTAWWALIVAEVVNGATVTNKTLWPIADYPSSTKYILLETIGSDLGLNVSAGAILGVENLGYTKVAVLVEGNATAGRVTTSNGATGSGSANYSRADELMRIFGRGDGQHLNVNISEMVFGSGDLTDGDRQELFEIMADYWGTEVPESVIFLYQPGDSIAGKGAFSRASTAEYVDENGDPQVAGVDVLRDNHWIVGQRTTLLTDD